MEQKNWPRLPFFSKICFQQPLRCYKNDPLTCTMIGRRPCAAKKKCCSRSVMLGNTRQSWPIFFTGKIAFFEQIFCRPLRSWKNDRITCTIFNMLPSGPLSVVPWVLSNSIVPEKVGLLFFPLKEQPFEKIASSKFWVLKKWSYNLNHSCQKPCAV